MRPWLERVAAIFLVLLCPTVLLASEPQAELEEFLDQELTRSGIPGAAYAIVKDGEIQASARGQKLARTEVALSPDTPFLIGSISKSFTAVAIMQLVEAGQIDLDGQIGDYLPEFAEPISGAVSPRELLSHTSGFSTIVGNSRRPGDGADEDLEAHVIWLAKQDQEFRPGVGWQYSNANYQILGRLIEVISGRDYAAYVEAEIMAPLGMENSSVSDGGLPPDGMAVAHRPWFTGHRPYPLESTGRVNAAAGGIFSSANDLALYLAMMLNGEDDVISAASKAEMLEPANPVVRFYGLGWFIDADKGTVYHGGLVAGTETLATMKPAANEAVVVLVNANSGIGFGETHALRNGISARVLGLDYAGEASRFWTQVTYLSVMALPLIFVLCVVVAWRGRSALAAKSGVFGLFSLWFPVVAMGVMAWMLAVQIPQWFGGNLATMQLFQPDFGWAMLLSAILGPVWAIARLATAYRAKSTRVGARVS